MLSTETRLRLQGIADRIANGQEVSYEEMVWATKWADHHRTAATILRTARRRAINGIPAAGSLDEFIEQMDLGDPDPSTHLIGPQDPETLAKWFHAPDWLQHD